MFQKHLRNGAVALCLVVWSSQALAQDNRQTSPAYPTRAISIITPSAGGGADAAARIIGAALAQSMKASVIIDPRPGAGGNVASEFVARSFPDGHTLLLALNSMLSVNPALYSSIRFDPIADFRPIGILGTTPYALAAHPSVPVNSVSELIALANARPGSLAYSSSGHGSPSHLSAILFGLATGAQLQHVPYRTTSGATTDFLSGQVQLMFGSLYSLSPFIEAKRIRPLGVTGPSRSAFAPEIPAIAETAPSFEFLPWYGLLAPAQTPTNIVERLAKATSAVLASQDIREKLREQGVDVAFQDGPELTARTRRELETWKSIIESAGIRIE
jgi:tripartite-type tricarboxylate transporter receptor subunit TctC